MPASKSETRRCLVADCSNLINARGVCKTHWARARSLGLLEDTVGVVDVVAMDAAWKERQAAHRPPVEAPPAAVQVTSAPKQSSVVEAHLEAELAATRTAAAAARAQLATLRGGLVRVLDLAEGHYSDADLLRRVGDRPVPATATRDTDLHVYVIRTLFDRLIDESADEMTTGDTQLLKLLRAVVLGEVPTP